MNWKFKIGDRVEMTEEALKCNLFTQRHARPKSNRGTVIGVFSPLGITVQRDGLKRPAKYHIVFWRKLPRGPR